MTNLSKPSLSLLTNDHLTITISKHILGITNTVLFFSQIKNCCIPFNFPFFMLLIGPSQSGKTTWIKKLISHFSEINKTTLNSILYFHASNDSDIFTELLQKFDATHRPEEHIPHISFTSITEPETAILKVEKE